MRVVHLLPHRGGGAETYLDLLERLDGVRHERLAFASARTPAAAAPSIARGYAGTARRARPGDLVHAHGDVAAILALPILARRPAVWTTHGLHALRRARGPAGVAVRTGLRAVVGATSVTLCCSDAERDELARLVPAAWRDRLRVVPNGVDVPPALDPAARAAIRDELGVGRDVAVALYLGELEDRKDPLTAARAAASAAVDRGAPLVLLVAGDGPLRQQVEAVAPQVVRTLGFRRDPQRLLAAADIFVLPSRREGISFAVLEAMAHGLAMIVSDGPGNPEAVGDAGVVVTAGDVHGFADALGALAGDPTARAELGAAARDRVARAFTVTRLLDGVRTAYDAATAPGRGAGDATA